MSAPLMFLTFVGMKWEERRYLGSVDVELLPDSGRVGGGGEGGGASCAPAVILPAIPLFACCPEEGPDDR